ncbi:MAG: hypothetical protein KKB63_06245 [Alphaproteobacteria bacterium]|nr:hypothetical protein [Alphaproteobacteria bacterium]
MGDLLSRYGGIFNRPDIAVALGMISILSGCHEFLMAFTVEELKDERPAVYHLYLGRE